MFSTEKGKQGMTADERRHMAIEKYYTAYREYAQLDNVREHTRVEISGDTLIEINRYYGELKGEHILRVTEENQKWSEVSAEVTAYERAADQLVHMITVRRGTFHKDGIVAAG